MKIFRTSVAIISEYLLACRIHDTRWEEATQCLFILLIRTSFSNFMKYLLECRIHGATVAEMPLIATCSRYRRQGMCCHLMNVIEEVVIILFDYMERIYHRTLAYALINKEGTYHITYDWNTFVLTLIVR